MSLLEFGQWALPQAEKPRQYEVIVGADPEFESRATIAKRCEGHYKLHASVESLMQAAAEVLRSMRK